MKKFIITITVMTIIGVIILVGCKEESVTMSSYDGEHYTVETIEDGEARVEINLDGYEGLIEAYEDGLVSEEYLEEVLFNSQNNNF